MSRRVVNVFEDVVTMEVPSSMSAGCLERALRIYQKSITFARRGTYRINIVAGGMSTAGT
jgi:hypothetical protein